MEKLDRQHLSTEPELLSKYFEIVSYPVRYTSHCQPGPYPLIGGKEEGETARISTYDFDINDGNQYYTISLTTGGFINKQTENFSCSRDANPLIKIKNLDDKFNLPLIRLQLNKMFDWNEKITKENFKNIKVYLYH